MNLHDHSLSSIYYLIRSFSIGRHEISRADYEYLFRNLYTLKELSLEGGHKIYLLKTETGGRIEIV